MFTVSQRFKIVSAWLLSYLRGTPEPEHYPIAVREQQGVAPESAWLAYVLNWPGPCGLGTTEKQAREALAKNLRQIAAVRWSNGQRMPRPGTGLPIEFASTSRVDRDPTLLDEFIVKALGFSERDPVFVSDMSSLEDFGDDEDIAQIKARIQEHYGLAFSETDSTLVADILVRIRARDEA